jgi:alpha-L-fucosidase
LHPNNLSSGGLRAHARRNRLGNDSLGWDDYPQSRIQRYRFERWNGAKWITLTGGETPARTTILRIPRVSAQKVRLLLEGSKEMPHIAEIGLYDEPG